MSSNRILRVLLNMPYCVSFVIPETDVLKVFDDFDTTLIAKLSKAFPETWLVPATAKMANSSYYQALLFICLVGAKIDNNELAKTALSLITFRLWNGRLIWAPCRVIYK